MNRIWIAVVVLCLPGCSNNSERLDKIEKHAAKLQEKIDLHDEALMLHHKIIRRMQDQETAKIEEDSRAVKEKIRQTEDDIRRLEND